MDRLPGFRDFYPEPLPGKDAWSAEVRQYLFDRWRTCALRYGFREYDGPPLEPLELYTAKSGDEIVGQLYHFLDKGQRAVAMRPEMTPSLARMVAAHHRNYPKPIKWFAIPQLFRYERQQKGRLREHFQLNADIFGEKDPAVDAEIIALLIDTLRLLGLDQQDFVIRLSSRNAWQDFFVQHGGRPEQSYSFFQIIDKLERDTEEQSAAKLSGLGFSMDKVQSFISTATPTQELAAILDNLAARGLQEYAKIDYNVIRGLAYYTGPVFEAFDCKGEFRAIAGGGRYDNLVSLASEGKVDLPALGFGMGDVVLTELLKSRGKLPSFSSRIEVFCLIDDEARRSATLKLVQLLREAGRMVEYPLTPVKSDKQFKRASELGAKWVIQILMSEGNVLNARARNLGTRHEMVLPLNEVVGAIASVS